MLNPSNQAQRDPTEEDSSGSDAGSEVSLETDRFGFILTNGSTAESVGPSPELVRQREAKWINIMGQWDRILVKRGSKVKVQCQKGIPASLRAKCWPLLCGATDRMRRNENVYKSLDSQPGLQSWVDIIERDLDRQFPFHEMFVSKDGHGQRGLFRVLKAYTQYQPEEGYCQAQGPVAAVLLMNMPAEEAFWCLVQISEQYLPGYYSPLLEGVLFDAAMLSWVLKKTCPAAHKHLQQHGVEPLMFATDWLMCLFTRHLPFNTLLRVWDLFFCYGVRVLLQVAVVLVRRVLGRADQRKQCQGQMETLERLRGVREQVQEEDDAFIAEVCSVPLSSKDLERRTEKELEKWKKDRPSSTFDPRGRCYGYRMAWAKARLSVEEQDRRERERGNLSIPLVRSASTLSLSPSLLQKKWRKGGKLNTGDWEGGNRVVRHVSMGAREDWRSWNTSDIRNVKGLLKEEAVLEAREIKEELNLTEETEQEENLKELKTQKTPPEHTGERAITEKQTGEESPLKDSKTEESQTDPFPAKERTVENIPQPPKLTSLCAQEEKLDTVSQSQVQEKQSHECTDQASEAQDTHEEGEKALTDGEHASDTDPDQTKIGGAAAEATTEVAADSQEEPTRQADMKTEAGTENENAQQVNLIAVTEASESTSETSPDPQTDGDYEDSDLNNRDHPSDTQQKEKEVTKSMEENTYDNTESLEEKEKKEESHSTRNTDTDVVGETRDEAGDEADENAPAQDDLTVHEAKTDSGQHTSSDTEAEEDTTLPSSVEGPQRREDSDGSADAQNEAETAPADDKTSQSAGAVVTQPLPGQKETAEASNEASLCEKTIAEQTQIETKQATADSPTQDEALNHTTGAEEMSSEKTSSSEAPVSEQPTGRDCPDAAEEAESTEKVQENRTGDDEVFKSTEASGHPLPVFDAQAQVEDSACTKERPEPHDSSREQSSGRRSSRSSGDFCLRKSSSSRGPGLSRRLSEDLFTTPQKTPQPRCSPGDPESQPAAAGAAPGVTPSGEAAQDTSAQQPDAPRRFGLLRRLRGEQSKSSRAKGTAKMLVPQILIQDFSDGTGKTVEEEVEEKLSSRERRRRRRERERREKEEERSKKKKEKELEKERKKPMTRGKSFQGPREKHRDEVAKPAKTGSQTLRNSASYADSFF
ncbi:uncharacterized protein tbc1d10c isoform 1-T1 [Menidia menidia]